MGERSTEQLMEEAWGDSADVPSSHVEVGSLGDAAIHDTSSCKIHLGDRIVAVNHVSANTGSMQVELLQPKVTLWVLRDVDDSLSVQEVPLMPIQWTLCSLLLGWVTL